MEKSMLKIFMLLILFSCRPSPSFTEKERANIIEDVRSTLNSYYNDIRKDGLTAEFKYLDNSSDFFWVPPGYSSAISYDSVASILKQNAPKFKLVDNRFDTLSIIPLNMELATYTARITSTITDTLEQKLTVALVETGVLIKRKDGWKLLNGQTAIIDK